MTAACAGCSTPLPAPRHFIAGHAVCGDCFASLPGGFVPAEQLPTLPGKVDGVVGWAPLVLQCRACGVTYEGRHRSAATDVILSGFHFHTCEGREGKRRCPSCLAAAVKACPSMRCKQ